MNKTLIRGAMLVTLLSSSFASAWSEFRTPLPFKFGTYYNMYPLSQHDCCETEDWYLDVFGGAWQRTADSAFSACDSRCKVPFSTLLFGKSEFRLEEIFVNSDVGTAIPNNPFVAISTLKPRFDYTEYGAAFNMSGGARFCDNWRVGLRAQLPYRDIQVRPIVGLNDLDGENLSDVYRERVETNNLTAAGDKTNTVFVARLDFLSALKRVGFNSADQAVDLVDYTKVAAEVGPPVVAASSLKIADQIVSADSAANVDKANVIGSSTGEIPANVRWANLAANATDEVASNGSGVSNNNRGWFNTATDYAALGADSDAQSKLFVVPVLQKDGEPAPGTLTNGANLVYSAISAAVSDIDASGAAGFLDDNDIDVTDGHSQGIGNLDVELYLGHDWCCNERPAWIEVQFGAVFPTDKDVCNCKKVIMQPTGNNNHFELRGGAMLGWDAADWIKFKIDGAYSWVLKADEYVAIPFKGACVKNIGPCTCVEKKWEYVVGHFDATFFTNDCCGFDLGYEIYHKRCDQFYSKLCKATDLAGRADQDVDFGVLAYNTNRTSHKVRTGFFLNTEECQFFGGWSHVFAGKNIARETDLYAGFTVSF